jgi:protein involved in polysaccharide export with SLBB domain
MRHKRRRQELLSSLLLVALTWLAAPAGAQTTTPTTPGTPQPLPPGLQQMMSVENLTPQQRAALANALLKSGGVSTTTGVPPTTPTTPLTIDEQLDLMRRQGITPETTTPTTVPSTTPEELLPPPKIEADSTIVVVLTPRIDMPERLIQDPATGLIQFDGKPIADRLARLVGRNVFQLDRYGVLSMQGVYRIPLAGLTVEEASARIGAEPDLRIFDVIVTLLPLEATGSAALELFGSELFSNVPTTFAPASDISVPADYVLGPGDMISVQFYGNDNQLLQLPVNRDGTIQVPGIGPVQVAGMTFEEMRDRFTQRINEQMIGVRASITLGTLRSIRVFVMGDVNVPGSYTVSGLSTMTNALFTSGGIRRNGSLRNVALERNGEQVGRLDLYRMLLHGDTSSDLRVENGDVIFVPPIGRTVGVEGEVGRPAIYELRDEKSVGEVVALAGGLLPTAYARAAHIERVRGTGDRTVIDVDLTTPEGRRTPVETGDIVHVRPVLEDSRGTVALSGHVYDPREYQWFDGMRITDLVPSVEALKPGADLHYLLVRRELPPDRKVQLFSADLAAALAAPHSPVDLPLQSRDRVMVFDLQSDRSPVINPLLVELTQQARNGAAIPEVVISGRVNTPGQYPLEPDMRVSDLLRAGGLLHEAAYTLEAELTRYKVVAGESRETELINVDLQKVLAGDPTANVVLEPHDFLNVKEIPLWSEQESVEIVGEVRFPGIYPIHRNETLSSVLERAGGLTDMGFADGAFFVREDLKEREKEQLEQLSNRLESDLVSFSLQAAQQKIDATQVLGLGNSLLEQLRTVEPTGRLVINLERVMSSPGDPIYDLVVKNGDRLLVPQRTQEVTVIGEVQNATSHVYEPGLQRDDYVARSGGLTKQADRKRVYVVHANGEVATSQNSAWFKRASTDEMRPGDTVVVPIDAERMAPLAKWAAISQIIYQLGLAAAAANAVGVF